jgi:hypothetical protein
MPKTKMRLLNRPVVVTGLIATCLVAAASYLLCQVEPKTFPTFWDGAWYSITTITTIGYGDLVPHSPMGRLISVVLILSGISLFGVLVGLVSEMVRERLLKSDHITMKDLSDQLTENKALLSELLAERKQQNELLRQLLPKRDPDKPDKQ